MTSQCSCVVGLKQGVRRAGVSASACGTGGTIRAIDKTWPNQETTYIQRRAEVPPSWDRAVTGRVIK
jgi:hypothetical protein